LVTFAVYKGIVALNRLSFGRNWIWWVTKRNWGFFLTVNLFLRFTN